MTRIPDPIGTQPDLFGPSPEFPASSPDANSPRVDLIGDQAVVLRGFATEVAAALLEGIESVTRDAPFRHMSTPGGFRMSVAVTNCGPLGWTSDRRGYRYRPEDPDSGRPWPRMPNAFRTLAEDAASAAGFDGFAPDACLINRYEPGVRLSLHQDRDERDMTQPIVSVSLGMSAVFQFGGMSRSDRPSRVSLHHGDVVVWGGTDRLRFHGILPLKGAAHPVVGARRYNFTLRKAG